MIRMILLTLSMGLFTIPAHGIGCQDSGTVTLADGKEIEISKCQFIQSSQSTEGSVENEKCAFIYHKVSCNGTQLHVVVSMSRQNYPRNCHLFQSNDGFEESLRETCNEQALAAVAEGNVEDFTQTIMLKSLPFRPIGSREQGGGSVGQEN